MPRHLEGGKVSAATQRIDMNGQHPTREYLTYTYLYGEGLDPM
jgi:hypothetical protein